MANKKIKNVNKAKTSTPTFKEKPLQKRKVKTNLKRTNQSKELKELTRTWDEDLCE